MKLLKRSASTLVLAMMPAWAAAGTLAFEGTARGQNGDVLYQESHEVEGRCEDGHWQPETQQVHYRRPDESGHFASKKLSYPGSLLRPEVDFRQPEFDETLTIERSGEGSLKVRWSSPQGDDNTWTVASTDDLVADAGFDHFVRANWHALTDGESVGLRVLAPTRGKAYDFVAEPAPEPFEDADHSFRIRPAGLVMRLAVDPIRLGYRDDGLLTHYSGLGNIRRNQEENYVVSLRYEDSETPDCSLLPRN